MRTPTVDELAFIAIRDIGSNAPDIYCTTCGKKIPPILESGWMVEIPVNTDAVWTIVLCSDTCLKAFQGNGPFDSAEINRYIAGRLRAMRNL